MSHAKTTFLSILLLGACRETAPPADTDGPPDDAASFASGSEDALVAAAITGIGYLPVLAWWTTVPAIVDAVASENACPTLTLDPSGTATYVAAGCTGPSGKTWDGVFVGGNLPDLFSDDPPDADPMWMQFGAWQVDGLKFDGSLWQSEAMPSDVYTARADLTATLGRLPEAKWKADLDCRIDDTGAAACTSAAPAQMRVDGLGAFTTVGPWTLDASGLPTGTITLVGVDALRLDLDGIDPATGCIPASIDGAATDDVCIGELSAPVEPPPGGEVTVMGSVLSMLNDQVEATLWTVGPVASVVMSLRIGDATEVHPLAYAGPNAFDEDAWSVFLGEGDYVAGETTALEPFANPDVIAIKFHALDEAGDVVGCGFAGTAMGMPTDYFGWDECPETW